MEQFPSSLIDFQRRFSSEEACASWLFAARWPAGFVCPGCRGARAWTLKSKADTFECAACGRQTSVTCQQAAADDLVAGRLPDGDALQRHLGAATAGTTGLGLVP